MTAREMELIREAFNRGMEAEEARQKSPTARWDMRQAFEFGIKIGEERGRGLAKLKPLKEPR